MRRLKAGLKTHLYDLLRVLDTLRARELSQLVVGRTGHLAIGLHPSPTASPALSVIYRDAILEVPRLDEPDPLLMVI